MITEQTNVASANIDELSTLDMLTVINQEDQKVALAVQTQLPYIAKAVDVIVAALQQGGRLIYMGAGTSGRLGVLDASECPPTYGTDLNQVIACIAGGDQALKSAIENAEDDSQAGGQDLQQLKLNEKDVVVGIAASGRTPYVIGGLQYAKSKQAKTIALACVENSAMSKIAEITIAPIVGAEVITGSSRMKSGTAQKLVLNMLSSGTMIKMGKVYGNLMIDVKASNEKLRQRQIKIVRSVTGTTEESAIKALMQSDHHCKTAILMLLANLSAEQAQQQLNRHHGFLRCALQEIEKT